MSFGKPRLEDTEDFDDIDEEPAGMKYVKEVEDEDFGENPYGEPAYQDRYMLRTTAFAKEILEETEGSLLKEKSKQTIRIFVMNYLSQNTYMANLSKLRSSKWEEAPDPMALAKNDLEITMLLMQAGIARSDKNKPETHIILRNIKSHLNIAFTRTVGSDREGIINRKVMQETAQNITTKEIVNQPSPKKSFMRR